jgi:hypothetical protein
MSGLVALFLLFDSVIKLVKLPMAVEGTRQPGYPANRDLRGDPADRLPGRRDRDVHARR